MDGKKEFEELERLLHQSSLQWWVFKWCKDVDSEPIHAEKHVNNMPLAGVEMNGGG